MSPQRAHPLPQASKSEALPSCALRVRQNVSIVDHLGTGSSVLLCQPNETVPRMTVPDDVGHPFAHRPGEDGGGLRGKRLDEQFESQVDPCCGEKLARTLQFARELWLPVPCYRLTYLTQRLTRHALDLREFLHTAVGLLLDQVPRQFALEGDHGERLPQQIMQVTREAESFLLDL